MVCSDMYTWYDAYTDSDDIPYSVMARCVITLTLHDSTPRHAVVVYA